ncbi:MAG: SDR family oxidoreductase [Bacteroidia bacterium]
MANTYLFAGASSAMALATCKLLQNKQHRVIGISTKLDLPIYNDFYQVTGYDDVAYLPTIEEPINGLVYFSGSINLKPFNRFKKEDLILDYTINALGAALFTQKYLLNLKNSSTKGSIVFLSSVAATIGLPFHTSISMAKGAIEGLTKALASELAPNIRVNSVAPALVESPLSERLINTAEKKEAIAKKNPMQTVGTVTDIANAIAFLLNDESKWITGQTIAVDGGMNNLK